MRLTYTCRACKRRNFLNLREDNRANLQMKVNDEEVIVNCNNCGKTDKRHINRITAIPDNRVIIVSVVLGVVVTAILISYLGFIASFSFSIPIFVWRYEGEQAHKFNSVVIRRKSSN